MPSFHVDAMTVSPTSGLDVECNPTHYSEIGHEVAKCASNVVGDMSDRVRVRGEFGVTMARRGIEYPRSYSLCIEMKKRRRTVLELYSRSRNRLPSRTY